MRNPICPECGIECFEEEGYSNVFRCSNCNNLYTR